MTWSGPFSGIDLDDPLEASFPVDLWRKAYATHSVATERAWSAMGLVHSSNRNALTPERVDQLTFIYFNKYLL